MLRTFAIMLALFLSIAPVRAQLFEIALPTFSSSVSDDGNYTAVGPAVDGKISRSSLTRGLIYFSFTVIGGQTALDYLRDHRRLEVDAVILADRSERISGLGISQEKWGQSKDAWMSQFQAQGYFTFRTFMNTEKIAGDQLELQVRDVEGNVIKPIGYGPSSYRARVSITQ
jgi:hypothetical protein